MKKIAQLLVASLMLSSALSAVAGPDWATIEAARKAKLKGGVQQQIDASAPAALLPTGGHLVCPPQAPTKQLDHGPRATTSPYITDHRQAEYRSRMQACHDAGT